ncbi:ion channel [Microcella daejeonensis]|uniref:Ion channel n=1 Tax=Microcella daejeonensis TaxID=2994971 RepID=A0A9E8MIX7_9MICO|nr:potassium channel family protein [Microcella daejeonensis]WAB80400.1 ion channel [Microcella daejeonensis]
MSTETVDRRSRWETRMQVPLIVVGVLFVVGYSAFVLAPELPAAARAGITLLMAITWIVFAVDYAVRLGLTPRGGRRGFVRQNVIDLLSVIVPLVRGLRVINLIRTAPAFRARTGTAVRIEVTAYAAASAAYFVYFIALATLAAERDADGSTITTFGDAIWWAIVTLATVGYGDVYPVTVAGRVYAVMLMAGGVVIVGTASALIISYIMERIRPPSTPER